MSKADFLYLVAQEDLRPAVPELRPDGGPYGELALADFPIGILHLMVRTHATRSCAAGEGLTRAVQEECWNRNPRRRPNLDEVEERLYQIARDQEQREGPLTRMPTSRRKQELALLHEILPPKVAKALSEGRKVEPEPYDPVTVFFSDIVGFTKIGEMRPEKVMAMLDNVYSRFDALAAKHGLFKVETIGDAYMCAGGIPERQADHTLRVARFALEAVKAAAQVPVDPEDMGKGFVRIRCGFHSGRVVASVVGSTNPRYCLFGDTVNVASRMESCSEAGRITMSKTSHEYLQQQCPKAQSISRGLMNVKVREHDDSDEWPRWEGPRTDWKNTKRARATWSFSGSTRPPARSRWRWCRNRRPRPRTRSTRDRKCGSRFPRTPSPREREGWWWVGVKRRCRRPV